MRRIAANGRYHYGREPPEFLEQYTDFVAIGAFTIVMIFSRDVGHHSGGWLKNPDYERCWHLSLSFRGSDGHPMNPARRLERAPQMHRLAERLCDLFYGTNTRYIWAEPPFSKIGKRYQVWHYRVFCNEAWHPIVPRGEVYSKELTEKGWKSFSELYGHKPETVVDID
jgi:hypothetical protein